METTMPTTLIKSKFHWFDIFLASLCILLGMFTLAGMGSATSTTVRNIDASIGILKRETPFYIKNLDKIARLTNPINANAQFVVAIAVDFALILREVLILAFKFILKKILAFLLSSLRGVFDGLLSSVKTWVKTLSGLLDSVKSFLSALAIKVYAVEECSARTSAGIVAGLFGASEAEVDPEVNRKCAEGSKVNSISVTTPGIPDEFYVDNLTRNDYNNISNAVSNLRVESLISEVSTGIYPANQLEDGVQSDKSQNTQSLNGVTNKKQILSKASEIANSIGYIKCSKAPAEKGYSYNSISSYNPYCTEATSNAGQELLQVINLDTADLQFAKANISNAAPANCKSNGFISSTAKGNDSAGSLSYTTADGLFQSESFAASAVNYSGTYAINTLTSEQCDSANQFGALQTTVSTEVGASQQPDNVNSSIEGALQTVLNDAINDLIAGITKIINDFVQKVFQLVVTLVTKFVSSLPGGDFLSSSLTSSLSNSRDDIQNKITDGLNALRPQQ
jgi:hypothetical protein